VALILIPLERPTRFDTVVLISNPYYQSNPYSVLCRILQGIVVIGMISVPWSFTACRSSRQHGVDTWFLFGLWRYLLFSFPYQYTDQYTSLRCFWLVDSTLSCVTWQSIFNSMLVFSFVLMTLLVMMPLMTSFFLLLPATTSSSSTSNTTFLPLRTSRRPSYYFCFDSNSLLLCLYYSLSSSCIVRMLWQDGSRFV